MPPRIAPPHLDCPGFVRRLAGLAHGSDEAKGRYLPGLIEGKSVFAVAIDEGPKHRPESIACKAERSGNGFKLTGKKDFVVYGGSADMLVVAARTSGSDSDNDGFGDPDTSLESCDQPLGYVSQKTN